VVSSLSELAQQSASLWKGWSCWYQVTTHLGSELLVLPQQIGSSNNLPTMGL
jgi:hypothetical protein